MADADKGLSPSEEASQPSASNIRSCLECRRRKIRCDRKQPCSYCIKVRMQCIYPRSGQTSRSAFADQEFDVMTKIRRMEAHISRLEDRIGRLEDREDSTLRAVNAMQAEAGTTISQSKGKGVPLRIRPLRPMPEQQPLPESIAADPAASREFLASLRSDTFGQPAASIDSGTPGSDQPAIIPLHEPGGIPIFRSALPEVDLRSLHPPPDKVFTMWQIYLENVDPLLKLFHAPTVQAQVMEASRNTLGLSPIFESLLFAIYYAAVISVECDEWFQNALQTDRHVLSQRYRTGCERALAAADFMATPQLLSLQALALYLTCGRRELDENYTWSLVGVAIRIAIKLGLHRDPQPQGFSPFLCEIRRRTWWMLVCIEVRAAEDSNQDPMLHERHFDTQLPSNVNDADLSLHMMASGVSSATPSTANTSTSTPTMLVPVAGQSDMTYTLVRLELARAARRVAFSARFASHNGWAPMSALEKSAHLDKVAAQLQEAYFQHCDARMPISFVALASCRLILARLKLALYHPAQDDRLACSGPSLRVLVRTSIDIMDHAHALRQDPRYRRWCWLFQQHVDWDAAAFVLLSLNLRHFAEDIAGGGASGSGEAHGSAGAAASASMATAATSNTEGENVLISDDNVHEDLELRAWTAVDAFFRAWNGHVDPTREKKWQRLVRLRDRAHMQRMSAFSLANPSLPAGMQTPLPLPLPLSLPHLGGAAAPGTSGQMEQEQQQAPQQQGQDLSPSPSDLQGMAAGETPQQQTPIPATMATQHHQQEQHQQQQQQQHQMPGGLDWSNPAAAMMAMDESQWDSIEQALDSGEFTWPMDVDGHTFQSWI